MICKCCFSDIERLEYVCPICGYPQLIIGDENSADEIAESMEKHRRKLLRGITISVKTYSYTYSSQKLSEPCIEYEKLVECGELEYNKPVWTRKGFAEIFSARSFSLELFILGGDKKRCEKLEIKPNGAISHANIGVELCEGLSARVLVGTADNYSCSEKFKLV